MEMIDQINRQSDAHTQKSVYDSQYIYPESLLTTQSRSKNAIYKIKVSLNVFDNIYFLRFAFTRENTWTFQQMHSNNRLGKQNTHNKNDRNMIGYVCEGERERKTKQTNYHIVFCCSSYSQ